MSVIAEKLTVSHQVKKFHPKVHYRINKSPCSEKKLNVINAYVCTACFKKNTRIWIIISNNKNVLELQNKLQTIK